MPSNETIEELITKIFNYDLNSNNAEEVIFYFKRILTDFYSKFNKKINTKVNELKEIQRRKEQTTVLTKLDIEDFISSEVVKRIVLYKYLKGTNKTKLKKCDIIEQLILFIREVFRIHYASYNTKAIIKLNSFIRDCKVPSRSDKNISSRLSLE
ncbi:14259_t:CDS:1 [Funneliformis mosseae]|uniref:14259_t:CDS:1 n=1 Tax=Funneliformis mosseae TaxID=27381 RepID=A0A9N8YXA5_FUNMO|nr:14259_t:CDS:1 [Funneliformis mosseae]